MTCIVGYVDGEGTVWIAGDDTGTDGWAKTPRLDRKVFRKGEFVIGFTSSYRMGQLIQYTLQIPPHPEGMDDHEYMVVHFVEAVRSCLKEGGYATVDKEVTTGGNFLVGYRGVLYQIEDDFQVAISKRIFESVGCGSPFALGALAMYETFPVPNATVELILRSAIQVAASFSTGVGSGIEIVSTKDSQ